MSLELAIDAALEPGYFVGYRRAFGFVQEPEEVREGGCRARRLKLVIAGCCEKSGEVDDSYGTFGAFVGRLFCDWNRAGQTAGITPPSDFPSDGRPDGPFQAGHRAVQVKLCSERVTAIR